MSGRLSPSRTLKRGSRLDAIVVLELLHSDDFSNTYRARDGRRAETVIIQEYFPLLRAERAQDNVTVVAAGDMTGDSFETGLAGFLQQAQSLSALRDPHIRRVTHYAEANGTAYLLMPDEPGETLAAVLERNEEKVLSEKVLREMGRSLLSALRTLDNTGMVHGDISPHTIFVRREGEALLTDFGMARHDFFESCGLAQEGLRQGYAPLEMYGARHDQGVWTDIYSLGATLYRCVAGIDPVSSMQRAKSIASGEGDPMAAASEIAAGRFTRGFLGEIDDMLVLNPEQRPRDPSVMLGLDAQSSPVNFKSVEIDEERGGAAETANPPANQGRWGMLAGAVTALVVTLLAGYWYNNRDSEDPAVKQAAVETPTSVVKPITTPEQGEPQDATTEAATEDGVDQRLSKTTDEKRIDEYRKIRQEEDERALAKEIERRVAVRLNEERAQTQEQADSEAAQLKSRNDEQLASLLDDAKRAFDEGRVATPPGNSAIYFYQEALYIERDNATARAGLDRVFEDLKQRARTLISEGKISEARGLIEVVRLNRPDDEEIDQLIALASSSQAERDDELRQAAVQESSAELAEEKNRQKSTVSRSLERGFLALKRKQFVTPFDDSAAQNFRSALTADPGNSEAAEGMNVVYQALATSAMDAVDEQRMDDAQTHLRSIETLDKTHPLALLVKRSIDARRAAPVTEDNRDAVIAELTSRAEVAEARLQAMGATRRSDESSDREQVRLRLSEQEQQIAELNNQVQLSAAREQNLTRQLERARSASSTPSAPGQSVATASNDTGPSIDTGVLDGVAAYYAGDYTTAFNLLRPIAGTGDARAQFRVGVMYFHGRGVQTDSVEADRWFSAAIDSVKNRAVQGESWAQSDLGTMYERGWSVGQNYEVAASWYEKAVSQSYAPAQNNLGVLLEQGLGVPRDRSAAIRLLRLAAAQGDAIAQENLTILDGN